MACRSFNDLEDLAVDVDDETFLRNSGWSGYTGYQTDGPSQFPSSASDLEEKRLQLIQKMNEVELRTAQSTQRSLSYLRNSEEVGIATAEELLRQREQLERTEKRLDDINTTLRFSQKHIQNIKSVFGGLKNLFSKKNEPIPTSTSADYVPNKTPLNDIVEKSSSNSLQTEAHPGLRIRGLCEQEEENVQDKCQLVIEKNLDEMLGSVTRLKALAHGLGEEIESHNEIIENVINKAEKVDVSISRKNKDIKRMLK